MDAAGGVWCDGRKPRSRRIDLDAATICWNDDPGGNTDHIAPTGITKAEVESIIRNLRLTVDRSRTSKRPCKIGTLPDGREVKVVWEVLSDHPPAVYPVTAYQVN